MNRAGLDAFGTADALRFTDKRDLCGRFPSRCVQLQHRELQQLRQACNGFLAARRALVRKMKFGISEGMVMAAGPGGEEIYLLSPDSGAKPGQRIK